MVAKTKKIRVLIADDHAILRQGLRQILSTTDDLAVVAEAENGAQLLDLAERCAWDVCVLDITMPAGNGIDVMKELRKRYPKLPTLIFSMHPESQYAVRAIQCGAAGYLSKQSDPAELLAAIRKIAAGEKYISAAVATSLAEIIASGGKSSPQDSLSEREREVLKLMASGKTITQIADLLNIGVATVSTYRSRLLEKLNLSSTAELIRFGLENDLSA